MTTDIKFPAQCTIPVPLGFLGTLPQPLLSSLCGTACSLGPVSLPQTPPPAGQPPLYHKKTLDFPRLLSDLSNSCSPRLGRLTATLPETDGRSGVHLLSVMFSRHIYKAFHTLLTSSTISQTPKAARCTPHAGKKSCIPTCRLGPPAQLSLLPPFIYSFLCSCGQHATQLFMLSLFKFLTGTIILSPQITHYQRNELPYLTLLIVIWRSYQQIFP